MCAEYEFSEDNYFSLEVMCKNFENAVQRAVEEIVGKEEYFYCNSCNMCFSEKELEQNKYCKFCKKEVVDLRDYES